MIISVWLSLFGEPYDLREIRAGQGLRLHVDERKVLEIVRAFALSAELQFQGEGRNRIDVQGVVGLIKNIEVVSVHRDLVGLLQVR